MNLVERLEQCRKQLDRNIIERLIAQDYDMVEADIRRRYAPEPLVYCTKCNLPIAAKHGITQHVICPETTSNQDGR